MPEYRYLGVNVAGKPIQGVLFGSDGKAVKSRIKKLVDKKGFRLDAIQKKTRFTYKVQKGGEKPITGEQKAFAKEELENALMKMGYRVHYVRKKWLSINFGIPNRDLVLFIRICADLLREKFPYDEILTLTAEDTENKRLRETIREIQKDLKAGNDGHEVYGKHQDVLGKFTAHMLAVASTSGNMAAMYDSTAKFLERYEEFKKNLRSVLYMPIVVTITMIGALIFYIMYIFPKMTSLLTKYDIEIPPMTKATLGLSVFLQNNVILILVVFVLPISAFIYWMRTEKGRYIIDRTLIRIPYFGSVLHKNCIEIFARVFYALYSKSGENIQAIRIAAESCNNKFIERQIVNNVIPRMLKEGKSFVECLERTNCFTVTAIRRFRAGEESGTLRESARQLADYYEKESGHKMKRMVDSINLMVSIVVSLMIIGLTLISSEIGFVSPKSPMSKTYESKR